jgi:alpha-D-ribose 1-methylphosphonate 5-triphosphate synthase subunit PhnG
MNLQGRFAMSADPASGNETARRERMALLARAPGAELARLWAATGIEIEAEPVRGPETGLATVRGRIGGGGSPFNLGEVTVTRATVRLAGGAVGHAYALGRDQEKARLAAMLDALCQDPQWAERIEEKILGPLRTGLAEVDAKTKEETAATRVDFFTLVRGED